MDALRRPVLAVLLLLGVVLAAVRAGPQAQELPRELHQPQQEQLPELQQEAEQKQLLQEETPEGDGWGSSEWQEDALAIATARLAEQLSRQGLGASAPFTLLLDPDTSLWGEQPSPLASPLASARAAWPSPALDALRAALPSCSTPLDLSTCARRALLSLLDRVARARELRAWGGALTVTADPHAPVLAAAPTERQEEEGREAQAEGARAAGDEDGMDALIAEKVAALAATRTLTLRLPPGAVDAAKRSLEEFRGKKGKGLLPAIVVLALMMKGMLMALAMGTIALIAGKALTVGLMALVISGVIGLKKLASQGGGGYEVVNVQAPHHYARTLVVEKQNHLHPYRAHAPKHPAAAIPKPAAAAAASATDVSLGDKDTDARR